MYSFLKAFLVLMKL